MKKIDKILLSMFELTKNSKPLTIYEYRSCIKRHESNLHRQDTLMFEIMDSKDVRMLEIMDDPYDDFPIDYYELTFCGLWRVYTKGVLKL